MGHQLVMMIANNRQLEEQLRPTGKCKSMHIIQSTNETTTHNRFNEARIDPLAPRQHLHKHLNQNQNQQQQQQQQQKQRDHISQMTQFHHRNQTSKRIIMSNLSNDKKPTKSSSSSIISSLSGSSALLCNVSITQSIPIPIAAVSATTTTTTTTNQQYYSRSAKATRPSLSSAKNIKLSLQLHKFNLMILTVSLSLVLLTTGYLPVSETLAAQSNGSGGGTGQLIKTLSDAIPEVPYHILHNMRQIDHAAPFYSVTKMGAKDSSNNHYTMVSSLASGLASKASGASSSADQLTSLIRSPIWKRIADGYGEFTSEFRSMLRSHQGGLKTPTSPTKLIRDLSVPALLYLLVAAMPDEWRPTRNRRKSQSQLLPTDSLIASSNPLISYTQQPTNQHQQQQTNSYSLYPANQQHQLINLPPQTAAAFSSNPQASMDQMTNSLYYNSAAMKQVVSPMDGSVSISQQHPGDLQTSGSSSSLFSSPTAASSGMLLNGAGGQQITSTVSSPLTSAASVSSATLSGPQSLHLSNQLMRRHSNTGLTYNDMNMNEQQQFNHNNNNNNDGGNDGGTIQGDRQRSTWSNILHHAVGSLTSAMSRQNNAGHNQQQDVTTGGVAGGKMNGGSGIGANLASSLINRDSIKELLFHNSGASGASPLILSAMTLASAASNSGLLSSVTNSNHNYNQHQPQERSSSSPINGNNQQQRDLTQYLPNTWRDALKRTANNVQQQATNQWKSIEGQVKDWMDKKIKSFAPTTSSSSNNSTTDQAVSSLVSSLSSAAMNVLGFTGSGKMSTTSPNSPASTHPNGVSSSSSAASSSPTGGSSYPTISSSSSPSSSSAPSSRSSSGQHSSMSM